MYVSLLSTGHRYKGLHNVFHLHLFVNKFCPHKMDIFRKSFHGVCGYCILVRICVVHEIKS